MMNQWHMFNFSIQKDEKHYVFQLLPGSNWEEIQAVLDEFKVEFKALQEQAVKQEEERKVKAAQEGQ